MGANKMDNGQNKMGVLCENIQWIELFTKKIELCTTTISIYTAGIVPCKTEIS